jgi:hypothetical protein
LQVTTSNPEPAADHRQQAGNNEAKNTWDLEFNYFSTAWLNINLCSTNDHSLLFFLLQRTLGCDSGSVNPST